MQEVIVKSYVLAYAVTKGNSHEGISNEGQIKLISWSILHLLNVKINFPKNDEDR